VEEMPEHDHTVGAINDNEADNNGIRLTSFSIGTPFFSGNTGGSAPHKIDPRALSLKLLRRIS
jgi:hypothetical protein